MRKIFTSALVLFILCAFSLTAFASSPRVVDDAGLMSESEIEMLTELADKYSTEKNLDIVIVTKNGIGGQSIMTYSDMFIIEGEYGFNSSYDCILFLIDMDQRDWWISTSGRAIDIFTDYGINNIGTEVASYLSNGEYANAFEKFIELSNGYINDFNTTGNAIDYDNQPQGFPFEYLLGALIVTLVVTIVVMVVLVKQLNNAKPKNSAGDYLAAFNLRVNRDVFLYTRTTRTARAENNSSGGGRGGSSTHSTGGRTFGGGGGKF